MDTTKAKILIVDDQLIVRELLKGLLISEGYELAFAANGPEALAQLEQIKPDVILLDVMMPGMDGFEVCQRLKADEQWQHVPIILITALDSKADLVRGLDAGADDFLPKPVNSLELRARVRSMLRIKKQFDELQATLQLREDMAAMIVHDIRTPLTVIRGISELLKDGIITSDSSQDIEAIHNQSLRLEAFTTEMLMLAKMEHGQLILNRTAVNINQLVLEVQEHHKIVAQRRRNKLVINLPPGEPPQIYLDANLFGRIVDNLLSNALKFSPPQSTVTTVVEYPEQTGAEKPTPSLRFKVLDEGPGIPKAHRDSIFDKFKIVDLKKNDVAQVGLGLTFCKLAVEAHGGRIFVEANQPRGAVFTVEI